MAYTLRRGFSSLGHQLTVRNFSNASPYKETKRRVLDADINCIETLGSSENAHPIFFLPGAFGSIELDFLPLVPSLNKEKYKWFSWDPPGQGKSRPPKREFNSKRFESVYLLDVDYGKELMNVFGYQRYTLLAWSGAGQTAISMASDQPEKVTGLITWGAFAYVGTESIPTLEVMKKLGLKSIPDVRRKELVGMYGEAPLAEMWNDWCDESIRMAYSEEFKRNGLFKAKIRKVKCPSLVIHGTRDAIAGVCHAHYLAKNLGGSKLQIVENGTHNLHLKHTKEFVQFVEEFVDGTANTTQ